MEWLLTRPVVISFALLGGALSLVAMLLKHKGRDIFARKMDIAGYVVMGISMLLFITVGFRGQT